MQEFVKAKRCRIMAIVVLSSLMIFYLASKGTEPAFGDEPGVIELSNHPQLFLDDYLIAKTWNLRREMKQPMRHSANPLMQQDHPWEKRLVQLYGTVMFEPQRDLFRCWYTVSEAGLAKPEYNTCYAESPDGIRWEKPMVGTVPFGQFARYTGHNMVAPGVHSLTVLKTPWDPDPDRLYKLAGCDKCGTSPDGIHWELTNIRDAVGKNDTGSSLVYWNGEYLFFVRNQEPETGTVIYDSNNDADWSGTMRGVGLSVSRDFRRWTKKVSILRTDDEDGFPWSQPHALNVTPYGDVLIGLLTVMDIIPATDNNIMGDMNVQLVVSRDGRNWQRVADRAVFFPQLKAEPITERSWELRTHVGSNMFLKDDMVYLYYFGTLLRWGEGGWVNGRLRFGGVGGEALAVEHETIGPRQFGIGLATLPADRFVSLRPRNWMAEGVLETKPFTFSGSDLLVNAEISQKGFPAQARNSRGEIVDVDLGMGLLQAEILNLDGKPLPGFTAAESIAERHDKLRYRIRWQTAGQPIRTLADVLQQPVVIRFTLKNGDFYAFQIDDDT